MRPWPRAAAAAAAFIFKLLSGQRARRGRGPRPAANLILSRPAAARPPSGLALAWLPAYLRVRPARAPHAGRSPWLWRHWRFLGGLSGGDGGGPRPGRGSRGASRPTRPAGNDLEAAALGVGEVDAGGQRSFELPATRCRSSATAILLLCPAPAQSWSRPNPIVQPGLGLASPHVPSAQGTATPAVLEYGATAGTARGPRLRPAVQYWEPHYAPSVPVSGRTPSWGIETGHAVSPCGRAMVRAARLKTM